MSEDRVAPRTAAGRSLLALYKGAEWDREYILAIEAEAASLDSDELRKAANQMVDAANAVLYSLRTAQTRRADDEALAMLDAAANDLGALLSAGDKAAHAPNCITLQDPEDKTWECDCGLVTPSWKRKWAGDKAEAPLTPERNDSDG